MTLSDDIGYEIMEHYLASLAQTVNGRENRLLPYRSSESLMYLLHGAKIDRPLYARADDDDPPPYDKTYYALCFALVTDDEEFWNSVGQKLPEQIAFLQGKGTPEEGFGQ